MTLPSDNLRPVNRERLQAFSGLLDKARATVAAEHLQRTGAKSDELRDDGLAGKRRVLQVRKT